VEALESFAQAAAAAIEHARRTDVLSRYGGDEFAVIPAGQPVPKSNTPTQIHWFTAIFLWNSTLFRVTILHVHAGPGVEDP